MSGPGVRTVETPGGRLFVSEADTGSVARALVATGRYEKDWTRWIEAVVAPGRRALDVGANIGYYTALLARIVGPRGLVVACEPDPGNAALLRRAIADNGFTHVRLVEAAVADRGGRATLFRDASWHGVHSLAPDNCVHPGDSRVEVATTTVDALVAEHGAFDFVKLDAQGAEARILAAAGALLAQPAATVLVEVWPRGLAALGGSIGDIVEPFVEHGFTAHALGPDRRLGPIDPRSIEARAAGLGRWSSFNVVWIK